MRIELTSQPLNEAIAKLERIAALYERIGGAQGTVAAGPAGGGRVRGGGGGGGRVVSGRSTVGGRGGGGGGGLVENLMRSNPGLTREQASVMAGNLPGEAARTPAFAPDYQRIGQEAVGSLRRQRQLKSLADREAERLVNDEYKSIMQERRAQFGGGGGGGGGGRGRGGIGGGPGRSGQPFFRERMRLGGTGLVAGIGGPWALAGAAVFGFVTAVRGAIDSVNELHKAALITGGSMQEVARLQTLGVNATEANALRARMATDPFTIMSMGYMPDPRFGGPQNNAALVQTSIDRLRRLKGKPEAQLQLARQMGVGEDVIAAANLGGEVYAGAQRVAAGAPTTRQAEILANAGGTFRNIWQATKDAAGSGAANYLAFGEKVGNAIRGGLGMAPWHPFTGGADQKGPDSPQNTMDANTRALNDLSSVIQTTNRAMVGRGMQDRGAFPSALFGTELMRGIRGGAIRMGAFH